MKKLFVCLLGLLCAAALPLLVFAAPAEAEQAQQAVMDGVYQLGQLPDSDAQSSQTGALGGEVQTFALDPSVEGAADLEALLVTALNREDVFSAPATGESASATLPSLRIEVISLGFPATLNSSGSSSKYLAPEFAQALQAVVNAHPEWYFLDVNYEFGVIQRQGTFRVKSLTLHSTGLYGEALDAQRAALDEFVSELVDSLPARADDTTKAVLLHDYLSSHVVYDYTGSDDRYNMYGALIENRAVCQGLALAYEYLLESCGIPSCIVSSQSMDHAWNAVYLDGVWYQADCTWDQSNLGANDHDGLLLSKSEMTAFHHGGGSDQTCADLEWGDASLSGSWWSGLTAPVLYDGSGQLYWSQNGGSENGYTSLIYTSPADADGSGTLLFDAGTYATTSGVAHTTASAPIACDGERLYVAEANTVYAFDLQGLPDDCTPAVSYPNRVSDPSLWRLTGLLARPDGELGVIWYAGVTVGATPVEFGVLPVDGVVLENADPTETAQALSDWLAGLPLPEGALLSAADYNNDGVVELVDLVLMAQALRA